MSSWPAVDDSFTTNKGSLDPVPSAEWNARGDAAMKMENVLVPSLNNQTGTTYTLQFADYARIVGMNNASPNTISIPLNASVAFPIGTIILIRQVGVGQTSIAADTVVQSDTFSRTVRRRRRRRARTRNPSSAPWRRRNRARRRRARRVKGVPGCGWRWACSSRAGPRPPGTSTSSPKPRRRRPPSSATTPSSSTIGA